jgi:hypothetical protein
VVQGSRTAPIPLSNRRGIASLTKDRPGRAFGVDRLSLSFPVREFDRDLASWGSVTESLSRDGQRVSRYGASLELDGGASVFVGVLDRSDAPSRPIGKVEFNPSRVEDPEGCSLAPVASCESAVLSAVGAAFELLTVDQGLRVEDLSVKRLDVARDFHDVSSPSATLRALGPVNRPWSRKNAVFSDPAAHGAQTLYVGSGAGGARAYDKHVETGGVAAPGTVRFEAECRSGWCDRYGGIVRLGDLDEDSVGRLALDRWEWSAMGVEVTSTAGVVEAVGQSGLSRREQAMFLGWLVSQSTAYAYEPSSASLAKFRRLQRSLGIAVGPEAVASVGFVSRLDWESGSEVRRVA